MQQIIEKRVRGKIKFVIYLKEVDGYIIRDYMTQIRECNCLEQRCKGKFLSRVNDMYICPYEAVRLGLVNSLEEYYRL